MPEDAVSGNDVPEVAVEHERPANRFVASLDGQQAGLLAYELEDGVYDLQHTVVRPTFRGRGIASTLIAKVLQSVRNEGALVLPSCPFVLAYLQEHPDEVGLVPKGLRAGFGL